MVFVLKSLVAPLPVAKALQPYLKVLLSRRVRHPAAFDDLMSLLMSDNIDDPGSHEKSLCQGVGAAVTAARAAQKSARSSDNRLDAGQQVRLRGLQMQYELNGKLGKVVRFDQESDQYVIDLNDSDDQLTVKTENLQKSLDSPLKVRNVCAHCAAEPMGRKLQKCSKCALVSYCSKACQVSNWAVHKLVCGQEAEACEDGTYDLEDFLSNLTAEEYASTIVNGLPEGQHTPEMHMICSRGILAKFTPKVLKHMEKAGTCLTKNMAFADSQAGAVAQFIPDSLVWNPTDPAKWVNYSVRVDVFDGSDWRTVANSDGSEHPVVKSFSEGENMKSHIPSWSPYETGRYSTTCLMGWDTPTEYTNQVRLVTKDRLMLSHLDLYGDVLMNQC